MRERVKGGADGVWQEKRLNQGSETQGHRWDVKGEHFWITGAAFEISLTDT